MAVLSRMPEKKVSQRAFLSVNCFKALVLLKKGVAYQIRGRWRFRGVRASVEGKVMSSLLEKGFIESVENQTCLQMRITQEGRSAVEMFRICEKTHSVVFSAKGLRELDASAYSC